MPASRKDCERLPRPRSRSAFVRGIARQSVYAPGPVQRGVHDAGVAPDRLHTSPARPGRHYRGRGGRREAPRCLAVALAASLTARLACRQGYVVAGPEERSVANTAESAHRSGLTEKVTSSRAIIDLVEYMEEVRHGPARNRRVLRQKAAEARKRKNETVYRPEQDLNLRRQSLIDNE